MKNTNSNITVMCPKCGHEFELSHAVLSGLRDQVQADLNSAHEKERSKLAEQLEEISSKEKLLRDQEAKLKLQSENQSELIETKLEEAKVALLAKAESKIRSDLDLQIKELSKERDQKSAALKDAQVKELNFIREKRLLQEEKEQFDLKLQKTIENEREKIRESATVQAKRDAETKIRQDLDLQLKELAKERDEKSEALKEAQKKELEFLKEKRQLKEAEEQFELNLQKTLDAERQSIREATLKQASEEQLRKLSEKDRVVDDLKRTIEDLRRKADQGSQQLQGEALELDIEDTLSETFPIDDVNEVPKGIKGADLIQTVRSSTGRKAGTIAIEIKQTKAWSDGWIHKLKEDQRHVSADVGVIVTAVLPKDVEGFGQKEGVWVCSIASFPALISILRWSLIQTHAQRVANENRDTKQEILFNYITGTEFRQKVEGVFESFIIMRSDLEKERKAMERVWNSRSKSITQAERHTAAMFGDMQGLSGGAIKDIPALSLTE